MNFCMNVLVHICICMVYIQLLDVVFVDYLLVNGRGIYPLV